MTSFSRSVDSTTGYSSCSTPRWLTATASLRADTASPKVSVMIRRPARAQSQTAYLLRHAVIALAPILLSGCYFARAAFVEGRILWNRKPIDDVLARKDLPADTRT